MKIIPAYDAKADPTEAVRLLVQTYPKATLFMRKDPKGRKT